MQTTERRYDIDWLRVIAIGLLLIYHIAIVFQPWGLLIGFIQSKEPLTGLWKPMTVLNVWRIPLLFCVSGMGVYFAMRKRSMKALLLERTRRIGIPLIFGALVIVPIHVLIFLKHYHLPLGYHPGRGHLWFLANIFAYVLLLSPLFYVLQQRSKNAFKAFFTRLYSHPLGLLAVAAPLMLETILLKPQPYEMYAQTWHGFALGFLAFFLGYTFVLAGESFWPTLRRYRWVSLGLAVSLYLLRSQVYKYQSPAYLTALETLSWLYALFAFAHSYLNKPGKTLSYLSQGAYPIYILHMVFIYWGASLILPLSIGAVMKFLTLLVFSFSGCFVGYELIRRTKWLQALFGLKRPREKPLNTTKSMSEEKQIEISAVS